LPWRDGQAVDGSAPAIPAGDHGSGEVAATSLGEYQRVWVAGDQPPQARIVIGVARLNPGLLPEREHRADITVAARANRPAHPAERTAR
jgi:hypothetical protein